MHPRRLAAVLAALSLTMAPAPAQDDTPRTTPEATDYGRTSTLAEVTAFLEALRRLPHADRLKFETFGKTSEGRELTLVTASLPGDQKDRLRALVNADIHAGEVEGKEAVQELLREIAMGEHEPLLQKMTVAFLPVYNGDGNERMDRKNRPEQNGPDAVGQRPNSQGLDLNRDFVKAEAPETRAMLAAFNRIDPHLFMDLHTTDGSYHGYHLTYAPSLSPNVDASVARLSRELLEGVREAMAQRHSFQVFDYGNFETHDWEGSGAPDSKGQKGWWTYDSRARYGTNYFGLRNRIAVLSEAYSYADFKTRIAATHDFVLEVLAWATRNAARVQSTCAQADARLAAHTEPLTFGFDTAFAEPERMAIQLGEIDQVDLPGLQQKRIVRREVQKQETMPVVRSFRARQHVDLPEGWAIPAASAAVKQLLALHGVRSEVLAQERQVRAEAFAVGAKRKPKRPFQGHQELELKGEWRAGERTLPVGTVLVSARQPLARVAAQLLEAQSEDGLSTWNFLEEQTGNEYPVLRILERLGPQEPAKAAAKGPEAKPADVASVEAIVHAVYDVISGDAGRKRDWDRMRSLFHPDARLVPMVKRKDGMQPVFLKVEDYVTRAGPDLERDGFHEQEIAHRIQQFGDIAQVFSSYESRHRKDDAEPFLRGVNSFQLCRQGGRWWVLQILWEQETDAGPIPPQYLK